MRGLGSKGGDCGRMRMHNQVKDRTFILSKAKTCRTLKDDQGIGKSLESRMLKMPVSVVVVDTQPERD